ncbi:MAG: helix-turn-helix domain-containing protein [Ruminococcaceae bacterium]|nr:helix-turn-helix domain-containing protein [Oscillospiraceae bacterium]
MNFEELLIKAKEGNQEAIMQIVEMYKPALLKNSMIHNKLDEDLYQQLTATVLKCIQAFQI